MNINTKNKILPHSEEAEKSILGSILLNNKIGEMSKIKPEYFYSEAHRKVFRVILQLSAKSKKIDPIVIHNELKKSSTGVAFSVTDLVDLVVGIPPSFDISNYLEILKNDWIRREAIRESENLSMAIVDSENVNDLLIHSSEKLKKLSEDSGVTENLGFTFGQLSNLDLPPREEIIFGLGRGEVGMLNAVNNAGKTTLLRNLMISLCTGKPFPPFGNFNLPKRVAFLDFEDSLEFLRSDLSKMLSGFADAGKARVNDNALLICDVRINDEEMSLSKSYHLFQITNRLKSFAPDLIIVDTISSAFQIRNENDNAEVRRFITRPLKMLAKDCNAALLSAHHIGKAKLEEGQTREASHKGRGASSFADMSRLVLNLEKDSIDDTIKLVCAKVKGSKFNDLKMKLNLEDRWFEAIGEIKELTNYEFIIEMFSDNKEYSTKEVVEEFKGVMSERLIKSNLNEAIKHKDLKKVRHGIYQSFEAWKNAENK